MPRKRSRTRALTRLVYRVLCHIFFKSSVVDLSRFSYLLMFYRRTRSANRERIINTRHHPAEQVFEGIRER